MGSFIIATELEVNPEYDNTGAPLIPPNWRGVINYKCVFPFEIRKTFSYSNAGVILSAKHISKSFIGPFSFAESSFSQRSNSETGYNFGGDGNATNTLTVPDGGTE